MDAKKTFNLLEQKLAASITVAQEQYLYFGGTAYLGIPQNEEFIQHYTDGIVRFGLNNGTSRGNNVQLAIYNQAEAYIAKKYGAADALITSSGYLAAKLVVQAYAQRGEVRYAPNTHPALWNNEDPKSNFSFLEWAEVIVEEINRSAKTDWVLITNSMNNLYPEIYNFNFINQLDPNKKVILIIDDSHGLGILNGGTSILTNFPNTTNVTVIVVASMAKALGVDAGVVLSTAEEIYKLKQSEVFYGASPPAAAGLYAFTQGLNIYTNAYNKLQHNIKFFTQNLTDISKWHYVPGFPVFLAKDPKISDTLARKNILISSFPYPDRNGDILNRIVLSSWHSETDIIKLLAALQN